MFECTEQIETKSAVLQPPEGPLTHPMRSPSNFHSASKFVLNEERPEKRCKQLTTAASCTSDMSRQHDDAEACPTAHQASNVSAAESSLIVCSDPSAIWLANAPDDVQTDDSLRCIAPLGLSPDDAQTDHRLKRSAPLLLSPSQVHIEKMPRDGSCLFHGTAYGLAKFGFRENGLLIRQSVATFIDFNPNFEVAGVPLRFWVAIDSETSVSEYAHRLLFGNLWGGEIEMKLICHIYSVDIAVYRKTDDGGGFELTNYFPVDAAPRGVVRLLFVGRNHYDAIDDILVVPVLYILLILGACLGVLGVSAIFSASVGGGVAVLLLLFIALAAFAFRWWRGLAFGASSLLHEKLWLQLGAASAAVLEEGGVQIGKDASRADEQCAKDVSMVNDEKMMVAI